MTPPRDDAAPEQHLSIHYRKKAVPIGLVHRVLEGQQRKMYRRFAAFFPPSPELSVLDLGVNGSLERPEQYFFESAYPYRDRIVAAGLEAPDRFKTCYPDVEYRKLEREGPLPFEDDAFDVVFCNAVIEHVGSREVQRRFLSELLRVGRRAFVTTPNRWYPVELHTVLPLVHYLPTPWYRAVFRTLGFSFFADEANLNLLDRGALRSLLPDGARAVIHGHRFLGLTSNLLLVVSQGTGTP